MDGWEGGTDGREGRTGRRDGWEGGTGVMAINN